MERKRCAKNFDVKGILDELSGAHIFFKLKKQCNSEIELVIPCDKQQIVSVFIVFSENGFFSDQEQILRLLDRPELLEHQFITFTHQKKKISFHIMLEKQEEFFKSFTDKRRKNA